MTRLKVACILGVTVGATGCMTLGPDFEEPTTHWLEDWQPDLYGQANTLEAQMDEDLSFWWLLFDDPILNQLIDEARQENIGLRIAGLRILESRAVLGIADSARYPQVQQATGALSYVNTREAGGSGSNQSLGSAQVGFNLGWELDFWGKYERGIESANAAYISSIHNQRDVQVLLSAQVAELYFAYRTALRRIEIAQENAKTQKRSYEITELLFESGQDSELDLQQAKTQYLATLSTIPGLELLLIQVGNSLSALLGRPPGELPELAHAEASLPLISPSIIREAPARLLLRRPDVRTAAWQAAAQSAQIGVAQADLYPSISLFGTIGWSGDTLSGSPQRGNLAAGPSLTWNLFDHGRIQNNILIQDARLQQAIENFQNQALQAAREIDDSAASVVKTSEEQVPLDRSVEAAKRSLELATIRYKEGYADFQRVLDAQRSVASQTERQIVNQGKHLSAIVDFYKGLGGGWTDMSIGAMIPEETREEMTERVDWNDALDSALPSVE